MQVGRMPGLMCHLDELRCQADPLVGPLSRLSPRLANKPHQHPLDGHHQESDGDAGNSRDDAKLQRDPEQDLEQQCA